MNNPDEQKHYINPDENVFGEAICICGDPACCKVDYLSGGGEEAVRPSGELHHSPSLPSEDWICTKCGKPANYKDYGIFYCTEHWEIHLWKTEYKGFLYYQDQ